MVLGGSDDGGYYLIGIKRMHPAAVRADRLEHRASVCADVERAREIGLQAELLPPGMTWTDAATLERLAAGTRCARRRRIQRHTHPRRISRACQPICTRVVQRDATPWVTNSALALLGLFLLALCRQGVNEIHHFVIGFGLVAMYQALGYLVAVWVVLNRPVNRWTLLIVDRLCHRLQAGLSLFSALSLYRYLPLRVGWASAGRRVSIRIATFPPILIWHFSAISIFIPTSIGETTHTPFIPREHRCFFCSSPESARRCAG